MFSTTNKSIPANPRHTGLTAAVRAMPVSDTNALIVEYGTPGRSSRAKRATLYQIASRLGYTLRVHDTGVHLEVWRVA